MILLDANILITAFRSDLPDHEVLRGWLQTRLSSNERMTFPAVVELAFVRICSHPRVFRQPSSMREIDSFLETLRGTGLWIESPWRERTRARWMKLCRDMALSGDDVNDAHLAALALEYRWTLASKDRGFARFAGLDWINPIGDRR